MIARLREALGALFLLLGTADVAVLSLVLAPRLARERETSEVRSAAVEQNHGAEAENGTRAQVPPSPMAPPVASSAPETRPEAQPRESAPAGPAETEAVDIQFLRDSVQISHGASEDLERVVATLRRHPQLRVVVRGHSCQLGTPEYNVDISRRRALAVEAFLVGHGVAAPRITVEAVGSTEPADRHQSAEALARNRRVQILWRE